MPRGPLLVLPEEVEGLVGTAGSVCSDWRLELGSFGGKC